MRKPFFCIEGGEMRTEDRVLELLEESRGRLFPEKDWRKC